MAFSQSVFQKLQFRAISCWSCGKDASKLISNLFCANCNTLQKPNKRISYFGLIGVNETYDVNANELSKKYKELQKHLHPDKFANKDKAEQQISEDYSSLVNQAYVTLLNPLYRATYMLELKGAETPDDSATDLDDEEFLMNILTKNSEVANVTSEDELMKLKEENDRILHDFEKQLSKSFRNGDLKEVLRLSKRMKYYTRIDKEIQSQISKRGIIQ